MNKILFCDIDGTLLHRNHLYSLKDWEGLREMREAGCLIVYSTARNRLEAYDVLRRFHLPYDYLILNNGSRIENAWGEELYSQTIPGKTGVEILRFCQKYRGFGIYFYDYGRNLSRELENGCQEDDGKSSGKDCREDQGKDTGKGGERSSGNRLREAEICRFWEAAESAATFDMIGICVCGARGGFSKYVEIGNEIRKTFGDRIRVSLNSLSLAVTARGQSKGGGMERLLERLGGRPRVYCIGDSANDISMFQRSDLSFTFHRAQQWVKAPADQCVNHVYEAALQILSDMPEENRRIVC